MRKAKVLAVLAVMLLLFQLTGVTAMTMASTDTEGEGRLEQAEASEETQVMERTEAETSKEETIGEETEKDDKKEGDKEAVVEEDKSDEVKVDEPKVEEELPQKTTEEKGEDNVKEKGDKGATEEEIETDEPDEEEEDNTFFPVESGLKQDSSKAKAFHFDGFPTLQRTGEAVAHTVQHGNTENMCLLEVEGEIDFSLPVPEEKKPVDIVVVQDASGSYAGNENQVKQSLKDIVQMLEPADRMMVTSYKGYKGYKSYRNLTNYNNGIVYDQTSSGTNVVTIDHTGLTNNEHTLYAGINQLNFDNATPTASGLQFAKNKYEAAIAGEDMSNRETIFILVTDGVANVQLDGYVHLNRQIGTAWNEANQFYQQSFDEVKSVANTIKAKGYTMVSAYWENITILRDGYGSNYYDNTVGPAAKQMVKDVASHPNLYSSNEDLAASIQAMLLSLYDAVNKYDGFEVSFDIAPGFELEANSIQLNGNHIDYTISGNTVTVTANSIKSGDSQLTYTLRETAVHGSSTTPIIEGQIQYDRQGQSFKEQLTIPDAMLQGNENSHRCELVIQKGVAHDGTATFGNSIELLDRGDSFQYKLDYQFPHNVSDYDSIQLIDGLEPVLELIGDVDNIIVHSDDIVSLDTSIQLLNDQSGFTIDVAKRSDSFDYLAGKTITVTFQAEIRQTSTYEDLVLYEDIRIPNVTQLSLDGELVESNPVFVQAPSLGRIKVIKVDEENQARLAGATFELRGPNDFLQTETTNSDGEIAWEALELGEYVLREIEAPTGYRLLENEQMIVIDTENVEVTTVIENSKQAWEIPETGGIGTGMFYILGLLLSVTALGFIMRRRKI